MQKLPTGKYLGAMVTLWGVAVTVTCAVSNFPGLVATRVLLGMFESAMAPALILITSMWYTRQEQPFRSVCHVCLLDSTFVILTKSSGPLVLWCRGGWNHRGLDIFRLSTLQWSTFQIMANHVSRHRPDYYCLRHCDLPSAARQSHGLPALDRGEIPRD